MGRYKWKDEEELFEFIRQNRDEFNTEDPDEYHGTHFLNKLHYRLRQVYVSILPHLTKLAITTILVFSISFFVWGNWLSPNKDKKTLGSVSIEYRMKEIKCNYLIFIGSTKLRVYGEWCLIKEEISEMDVQYDELQIDLKKNPKDERIVESMERYYMFKLKTIGDALKSHTQLKEDRKNEI